MATTSRTNSVVLDSISARARPLITARGILSLVAASALLAFCWRFAEIRPGVLLRLATAAAIWNFVSRLFPPDLSPEFLRSVLRAVAQTMAIAVAGTLLSLTVALPLGVLATGTLWNRGVLVAVDDRFAYRVGWMANRLARIILGFLRSVPDLLWALLFVAAVGLGSLAGTLALALAYSGVLGRVYADVFEHVDPRPLEALQSTGATRMQIFPRGIWPQAIPHLMAYSLYSFECCVRAAAVLGFVGAGGIGYEISVSMRMFEYGQVLTLLLVFIMLLTVTDAASRYVRARSVGRATSVRVMRTEGRSSLKVLTTKSRRLVAWMGVLAAILASFVLAGFASETLLQAGVASRLTDFVRRMLPLDLSWAFVSSLGTAPD